MDLIRSKENSKFFLKPPTYDSGFWVFNCCKKIIPWNIKDKKPCDYKYIKCYSCFDIESDYTDDFWGKSRGIIGSYIDLKKIINNKKGYTIEGINDILFYNDKNVKIIYKKNISWSLQKEYNLCNIINNIVSTDNINYNVSTNDYIDNNIINYLISKNKLKEFINKLTIINNNKVVRLTGTIYEITQNLTEINERLNNAGNCLTNSYNYYYY